MRFVAAIALALLLAGSLAHQHTDSADTAADPAAESEACSACVLAQSTVDPPTPAGDLLAPPQARVLDQAAPGAAAPILPVAPLSVAPKTSPPLA